jgi:hypothetical protein
MNDVTSAATAGDVPGAAGAVSAVAAEHKAPNSTSASDDPKNRHGLKRSFAFGKWPYAK